ncbi:33642_t:CDS:2 [Racocetra persica]|uniref:33642_t:CDS:1 n=1 Tax=Racocetra persica TaxID=160502 RepID=A0ACA9MRK4_9GLOM|nr:33642_t:CDS:2 [Racocetra persica]
MSKKKQPTSTDIFIDRIKGNIKLVKSFYDPFTPKLDGNLENWKDNWKKYNLDLHAKIVQEKIDLNWIEFCSRFNLCESLYNSIKKKEFDSSNLKNKEINRLIRETIPDPGNVYSNLYSITMFWRKSYDNLTLIIEEFDKEKIPREKILEKLRCSNITINYFQEVGPQDIKKLISCLMKKDN